MAAIVRIENLNKTYKDKIVFNNFNLDIEERSFTIVSGQSGSGKSTLLNIIGLLDKKTSGDITLFDQKNVTPFSKKSELLLRDRIGYLFQNYALVENKTVGYNLKIALENVKGTKDEKERMIRKALKEVGLEGYEDKNVYKCSGGEQQRIAIARLLLKPCELILADEPTGSLDYGNKMLVVELLNKLHADGKTIVMVTHDEELMAAGDTHINL